MIGLGQTDEEDRLHHYKILAVFCDGHTKVLEEDISAEKIRSLLTIAAGDNLEVTP